MKTMMFRCLPVVMGAVAFGTAQAETSPYYIGGSVAYSHQSNVLGLAENANVPTQLGYESKSDNVTSIALIGGIDQPIGRQRLFGDVTLRNNRYSRNDLLDNNSYSLSAGLDWETIENISGNLTLRGNRELVTFSTFEQPTGERNLVTTRQADASAKIGGVTRLTFEGGLGYRSVDYSDASFDPRDFRQYSEWLGLRYWPSGNSYAGVKFRVTQGRYPRFRQVTGGGFEQDEFDRRDIDLFTFLKFSAASSLYLRASHSNIDYDLQNRLDFSGFTGSAKGVWQPTVKVKLTAEVARDRGQDIEFLDFSTLSRVEASRLATALRLQGELEMTAKTGLTATAGYTRRSIFSTNIVGTEEDGSERVTRFGFGGWWTPTRTSRVGCDLSRERRRADVVAAGRLNVSANVASCYGQLTLQP